MPDNEKEHKFPEFIVIENEKQYREETTSFKENVFSDRLNFLEEHKKFSILTSVILFFLSLLSLGFLMIITPILVLLASINLITFFKVDQLRLQTKKLWSTFKNLFVTTIGLILAIFNPLFGFTVLMTYFMLKGQKVEEKWFTRFI